MGQPNVDVFFCSAPQSDERKEISKRCFEFWSGLEGINLYALSPEIMGCSLAEFNRERRVFADDVAIGTYIVTDDDCLPDGIGNAIEILGRHSDFAMLSFWPRNATIHPWTEIQAYEDGEVMEHVSVGGIRVCREGLPFPPSNGVGYDRTHADAIRARGQKVGYFKHLTMMHLGEGKTELWR